MINLLMIDDKRNYFCGCFGSHVSFGEFCMIVVMLSNTIIDLHLLAFLYAVVSAVGGLKVGVEAINQGIV